MDGERISDGLSAERKVEIRVRKNGRKDKVIVEKSAAEGLPEGWIKKLVITNRTGRKNRRDPFFIDPKSGYIFHSFKDASRYVETGDIGIYARKLKENDIENEDSGNGETVLLLESAAKRPADDLLEKEKNINIDVKQRKLSSFDEHPENCKRNSKSRVTSQVLVDLERKEKAKDPIEKHPIAKRITRSQAKASKNEEDCNFKIKTPPSSNAKTEEHTVKSRLSNASSQDPEKKTVMKEEVVQNSTEKRITRSKAKVMKSELSNSVTRRASKRLAGIELERTPELKTRVKAQRVLSLDELTAGKSKRPVNPLAIGGLKNLDIPLNKEVGKGFKEHSCPKPHATATSNKFVRAEMEMQIEKIGKPVGRKGSGDKKMKMPLVISEVEVNPVFHLDGYKQMEEISPVSPLSCKTSATQCDKTAAAKRLGPWSPKANKVTSLKATEMSPLRSSNKGEHPQPSSNGNAIQWRNKLSNDVPTSSVCRDAWSEVMEKNTNSFSSAFDSTLADIWKDPCIAFAIETLTGESLRLPNTAAISSDPNNSHAKQKGVSFFPDTHGNFNTGSAKPGLSSELGPDTWKDPCIDFAIKTLTGAIPVGIDEPKPEGVRITAPAMQEREGRQSSCDYLVQQCSKMEKKTVGKSGDLRFPQSFSKN